MADRVERLTNLLALLLETSEPLSLVQIADELTGQYPDAKTARRAAFERDKAVLRDIGVPIEQEIVGGADDGVGDDVRQVRGDGEHLIVVPGIHRLHGGADRAPERCNLLYRLRVAARWRCQDTPAVLEQLGESGLRATVLGPGDGMAGNEVHALGQGGRDVADDRLLYRADIADDGARLKAWRDALGDLRISAQRRADDDEVSALLGIAVRRPVISWIEQDADEETRLPAIYEVDAEPTICEP